MTNLEAVRRLCTAICSSFYADVQTVELVLFNEGIDADADATAKDAATLKAAVKLVRGYVETSRTEGGISVSIDRDALNDSILFWCNEYGVDSEEVMEDTVRVIYDGSSRW